MKGTELLSSLLSSGCVTQQMLTTGDDLCSSAAACSVFSLSMGSCLLGWVLYSHMQNTLSLTCGGPTAAGSHVLLVLLFTQKSECHFSEKDVFISAVVTISPSDYSVNICCVGFLLQSFFLRTFPEPHATLWICVRRRNCNRFLFSVLGLAMYVWWGCQQTCFKGAGEEG